MSTTRIYQWQTSVIDQCNQWQSFVCLAYSVILLSTNMAVRFSTSFSDNAAPLTSHLLKTVLYQLCTLLCLIGTVTTGAYAQTIMKLFLGSNNLQPLTIFVIFNYIIASSTKQLFITVPLFPPLQLWLLPQALPLRLWLQPDKQLNNSFSQCSHWTWNDGLIPQMSICVYSIYIYIYVH